MSTARRTPAEVNWPSFWLGAHCSMVVVGLVLAPISLGLTLSTCAISALCLWFNWASNFSEAPEQEREGE